MGWSGGTKTKTTSNETATTTPNVPDYLQGPVANYFAGVGNLQTRPANDFATPTNAIQSLAYGQAGSLAGTPNSLITAQQLAQQIAQGNGTAAAQTTTPGNYQVANVGQVAAPGLATADVSQAAGVKLGNQLMAEAGGVGLAEKAKSASLLDGLSNYMNPYINDVVNTTLAGSDQKDKADLGAYKAQAAGRGAYGGSRQAIGETMLMDNQARARSGLEAGLRSDAFNTGANLSNLDAGRRQETDIFNAGQQNENNRVGAQLATQSSIANAGNAASRDIAQANLSKDLNIFNAGAKNDASQFNAGQANDLWSQIYDTLNQNARQDASAMNAARSQFYDTAATDNRFNAEAKNQTNQFNANQRLQGVGLMGDLAQAQTSGDIARNNQLLTLGDSLWNQQNREALAPYTQMGALSELLNPALIAQLTGQTIQSNGTSTSKQSGGFLQSLLGPAAQLGAAAITKSERRVKKDIELIGRDGDGLGFYKFRYVWDADDAPLHRGTMVDEVERLRPWALGPVVDGVRTVDYSKLETI